MDRNVRWVAALAILLLFSATLRAQREDEAPPATTVTESAEPESDAPPPGASAEKVVIVREPLHLTNPAEYRVPLELEPINLLQLAAPADGFVRSILVRPGAMVGSQAEVVRMDNTEQQLILDRETALYQAAQIEARRAGGGDRELAELAQAKLDAAKADFELAKLRLERASVRAPFEGQILRVSAVEGQLVRLGDTLATLADATRLKVEVPVDRRNAAEGAPLQIDIEGTQVTATVQQVLPLNPRFEKLRDIVTSVASAIVVVDNVGNQFKPGQTVHSPLIPRHPVTEIANSCLSNTGGGARKVQVIRGNTVRDVTVEVLGQVGPERVHVSGPFVAGDEVIVSTSQPLADGTLVKPATIAAEPPPRAGAPGARPKVQPPRAPQRTQSGF